MARSRSREPRSLWTIGYGTWPSPIRAERLVSALVAEGITRLVDVRLNPCASAVQPGRYGPKPWTLQTGNAGIVGLLAPAGIAYEWLAELGNPQRQDRAMAVLRAHLANPGGDWPVHRGLDRLSALVEQPGERVALLCACGDARTCHRTVVAQALAARAFAGGLVIRDIPGRM